MCRAVAADSRAVPFHTVRRLQPKRLDSFALSFPIANGFRPRAILDLPWQ